MANRIDKVAARAGLKPRHTAYWQRIRKGCYVGFRKKSASGPGAWLACYRHEDTGKRVVHSLGALDHLPEGERFDAAQGAAEEWFRHMGAGGASEAKTVRAACEDYLRHLRSLGRGNAADDAEGRFRRFVYGDAKFAGIELLRLKHAQVKAWRTKLSGEPAIPQNKASEAPRRPRSAASINRDMTALRAALNYALAERHTTSAAAWETALKPIPHADNRREVYLDAKQRRRLIDKAAPDLAALLRALSLVPLRPGAVAALKVGHFDKRLGVLTIRTDKNGKPRQITLPAETSAFFAEQAENKLPSAPLLTRADGAAWNKDSWKGPFKVAAAAAKLPAEVTAYALRHSTITDLLALHKLDTLTVAQLADTSLAMIERFYGHLVRQHAKDALARLAL